MKKNAMLIVKYVVGLLPKSIKEWLKTHPLLLATYSKALQRSGLFFGFPSAAQLNKLYKYNIVVQDKHLSNCAELSESVSSTTIFVLVQDNLEDISKTLQSIQLCASLQNVYLLGARGANNDINSLHPNASWYDPNKINVNEVSSCLILNAGEQMHEKCLIAFSAYVCSQNNDVYYCDVDRIDAAGKRSNPQFYPDWNPELLLSSGYINSGVLITNQDLIQSFLSSVLPGVDHFCVAKWLAFTYLQGREASIEHVPLVLVHKTHNEMNNWHSSLSSILPMEIQSTSLLKGRLSSLKWPILHTPLVSLIIPTKDGYELVKSCIESILSKTTYSNYEIILVDNNSSDPSSLQYFESLEDNPKVTVLKYPKPFNYSAINNFAVQHTNGSIIGLINNDIEVISSQWLEYMVGHVVRADVGCVGAKLLYADGRIQHAGVVLGYGGGAGHAHKYFPRYHDGYLYRLNASNNYSAVTAACLVVEKSDYLAVGGLNEESLTVAFNDVDFCLKVLELGKRNVYCAEAELFHYESISRGLEDTAEKQARFCAELTYLQTHWEKYIADDPNYNPNLTLSRENFSIKQEKEFG